MKHDYLYVSEIAENGISGYTEDYPTICYNIGRVKDEEFFDRLLENIDKDGNVIQPFAAGKFVSVLTVDRDNSKWRIDFWDIGTDEKKAIDLAVRYEYEKSREFMAVFNTVSQGYDREYGKYKMVVGEAP